MMPVLTRATNHIGHIGILSRVDADLAEPKRIDWETARGILFHLPLSFALWWCISIFANVSSDVRSNDQRMVRYLKEENRVLRGRLPDRINITGKSGTGYSASATIWAGPSTMS